MPRQSTDDAARRIADRCQPAAEFGKRVGLNLMDEVSEHVVKYADLLVIKVFLRCRGKDRLRAGEFQCDDRSSLRLERLRALQ